MAHVLSDWSVSEVDMTLLHSFATKDGSSFERIPSNRLDLANVDFPEENHHIATSNRDTNETNQQEPDHLCRRPSWDMDG